MANMSYCRWENTANDLRDCMDALSEVGNIAEWYAGLSEYEQRGFRQVMEQAKFIVDEALVDVEAAGIEI